MIQPKEKNGTFCLVAGRHHGPESWIYVQEELERQGWNSIAPTLPIENQHFSLDDHAKVISLAEQGYDADEIWRVGWSWGANVIPRVTDFTPVRGLIFVAGAFHPETIRGRVRGKIPKTTHSLAYEAMEQNPDQEAREEMAEFVFYDDVEDEMLKALVIGGLRSHPRREYEPQLAPYPHAIPADYITLQNDKAFLVASQLETAKAIGISEPEKFESGHAPMFSQEKAKKLARLFIVLAKRQEASRKLLLEVS